MLDIHTCAECHANKDQVEEELVDPPVVAERHGHVSGGRGGGIYGTDVACAGDGGVGTSTLEGFKPLWRRTDESRVGSLPTRAAHEVPTAVTKVIEGKDKAF